MKDKYKGKRCFVVGNSTSLKNVDLTRLINEYVFVTNWFVLHDVYKELKHPFLCISDPHLWNYGIGFHNKLVEYILKNQNTLCFFELSSRRCVEKSLLSNMKVYYLRLKRGKKVWKSDFSIRVWEYVPWRYTVIIDFCLSLSYHFGFSEVYLIGVDCDYKLDMSKDFEVCYFYNIEDIPKEDLRHISVQRDKFKTQEKQQIWFAGFEGIRKVFEREGGIFTMQVLVESLEFLIE